MALPLLFMAASGLVRAATPAIARALVRQGIKKATTSQAKGTVTKIVSKVSDVSKLKSPATKVASKSKTTSTKTGSPSPAPKPKSKGLKPTRNPALAKTATKSNKKPTDKSKSTAVGTVTTIASLPLMSAIQKKDNKPANASTNSGKAKPTARDIIEKSIAEKKAKKQSPSKPLTDFQKIERDLKESQKRSPAKNFNVGVSKGGVSFKEAFRHFRNKGNKTFTWNGEKYTTKLKKK